MPDDDRMLERLGRALAPPPAQPDEAEIRTLRQLAGRVRARWRGAGARPDPSVLRPARGPTQVPPAILRPTVSTAGGREADIDGQGRPAALRLLA